jgi:plasmid stabilization system protein ParE
MAYKVIFAPTAITRLEDIVRYIAADDPAAAKVFAIVCSNAPTCFRNSQN